MCKAPRNHSRVKIEFTSNQLDRIKDLSISGRKLELEIGISAELINRTRTSLGLKFKRGKSRVKKEYTKVVKEKILQPSLKDLNKVKKNAFEVHNEEMNKAKKAKESFDAMEARKKSDGFKWITRIGRYGIKETVFIKQ